MCELLGISSRVLTRISLISAETSRYGSLVPAPLTAAGSHIRTGRACEATKKISSTKLEEFSGGQNFRAEQPVR